MAFMCRPSAKVMSNGTNLSAWSAGFGPDPRWGVYPRNK